MVKKVTEYMHKFHMLEKGDTVIVGVSGGADSVCLISVLSELKDSMALTLVCAHVNHMFRETALRDEQYVQELCARLEIPCHVKRVDVKALAEEAKMSFEEAGRKVRYSFFEELKEEYGEAKIAVAHNKGDCAETMLFHLFRGSHLKGLGGISPVNGCVIRPLLDVERDEIEAYLQAKGIAWQTDETNASTEYARNYIRHEILPAADKLCTGVERRLAETASALRETEDYMEERTKEAMIQYCESRDGGIYISEALTTKEHTVIVSRVLYRALEQISGVAKDLGKVHVQDLRGLIDLQLGRQISLPGGVVAYRSAGGILVRKESNVMTVQGGCMTDVHQNVEVATDSRASVAAGVSTAIGLLSNKDLEAGEVVQFELEGLGNVRARILINYELKNIPQKTYTKWFDYDKIIKCAVFRKRMEGDYLTINEEGGRKKLKEYFIQEKIPSYKRDEIWILADDQHIIWVPGFRMSTFYKITEKTERVLEVTIGGKENG